jgi:hypothetical protein
VKLPNDSIGISDILDWIECPRRASYKVQRFVSGEPPEAAANPTTKYGTAFHDAVEYIENNAGLITDYEAIQYLIANGHRWLTPEDIQHLKTDFETYRKRQPTGVRTVMNEAELKIPLFVHNGVQIYFRGRIDRLYQSLSNPDLYFHRDFKSSTFPKTKAEVDADLQMWAYNWALHEWMPEIGTLVQTYDQLQFGEIETSKTEAQREWMRDWLIMQITAILEDDEFGPDGLLVPSFNKWCRTCPIMESCPVVPQLSQYALAEISSLAPEVKDGRSTKVKLDPDLLDFYVGELEKVAQAKGVLERFEKTVKAHLQLLPPAQRERLGYALRHKSLDHFPPDALKAAHNLLGDDFYRVISLSKSSLATVGANETTEALILGMADKRKGQPFIQRKSMPRRRGRGQAAS